MLIVRALALLLEFLGANEEKEKVEYVRSTSGNDVANNSKFGSSNMT